MKTFAYVFTFLQSRGRISYYTAILSCMNTDTHMHKITDTIKARYVTKKLIL